MSELVQKPQRSRLSRFVRRSLRVLAWSLLGLLVLLVLLWVFRQQLLVPLLRPRLEALLAGELGAKRVSIGSIEGDWLQAIELRGLVVEGGQAPLRELRDGRVEASYSLWALLGGDLSGLRSAKVHIAAVELDLRPGGAVAAESTTPTPFDAAAYEPLLRLLPEGAQVRIDTLRLLAPNGERTQALAVDLQAGAAARRLTLSYGDLDIDCSPCGRDAASGAGPSATAQLQVQDPGAWLDLFGLGGDIHGGRLRAAVTANWSPPRVEAKIDLSDLMHEGQRLDKSQIEAMFDGERWVVRRATIDLPGVAVNLQDLTMPNLLADHAVSLRELAGTFSVHIDDLSEHAALLPEAVRSLLPVRGQLAGAFVDGSLQLAASQVEAQGLQLDIEQGTFPLTSEDWRAAEGSLRFDLSLDAFRPELPALGEPAVSGRVSGTLAGSLTAPRLDVQVDLGACHADAAAFTSARGTVHADARAIAVEGLAVVGLRIPSVGGTRGSKVRVDANCRLLDGGIDLDSIAAVLEVDSAVPSELLAPSFVALDLGPAPQGEVSLRLDARHGADGITVTSLHVQTAADSPVQLAIDGEGVLPVHWSGGSALTALDAGSLRLTLKAAQAPDGAETPLAFDGVLQVDPHSLSLRELAFAFGPCRLRGEVEAARGLGDLLDSGKDLATTAVNVDLDLEELDLAKVPAAWLPDLSVAGRLSGHVQARGAPRELLPEVVLTLVDGELRGEGLPTWTDTQLRLSFGSDAASGALLLTTDLSASVDPGEGSEDFGWDRSVALAAKVRCDETGTVLEPTKFKLGGGELALDLRSNLRRSALFAGFDAAQTTVTGTVGLSEFALDRLPGPLLGLGDLKGVVSGELAVDGTLATLGPQLVRTGKLTIRGAELKLNSLPRIEQLNAQIDCDAHQLVLHSLTGLMGAGHFSLQGTLRQADAPLWQAFDTATVDLQIDGDDVLLFRGDGAKVRTGLRVTARGTPQSLAVGGEIVLARGSKYVRRISILPDLSARGGETANEGLHLIELPPAIGDRLDFDVAIRTSEPFEVRTNVFDGQIDVAARLRGKGSTPRIEGTMSMRSGLLRFPGANLRVTSGLLTFTRREPLFPELLVQAEGKRMGILVSMTITGRYDRPQVQLSSVPPLPPQDLIVLLTTGQLPSTLAERGAQDQARFVGGYLAKEVFDSYFGSDSTERGESVFDRVTIEAGREVSKNGTESVLVEYELSPRLAVRVERDAYEDYNMGLVLRFRFR